MQSIGLAYYRVGRNIINFSLVEAIQVNETLEKVSIRMASGDFITVLKEDGTDDYEAFLQMAGQVPGYADSVKEYAARVDEAKKKGEEMAGSLKAAIIKHFAEHGINVEDVDITTDPNVAAMAAAVAVDELEASAASAGAGQPGQATPEQTTWANTLA